MRITIHSAILAAAALLATSAFASSKAVVNIPFAFVAQGHTFPAGQYEATSDPMRNMLALRSTTDTSVSARWVAGPADYNPNDEKLTLKFDDFGNTHALRTVQLGPEITSRLDAHARHHGAGSIAATVSGQ
jgi:predicted secreted protein